MNTGFLGPAVATVLTACGIETVIIHIQTSNHFVVATVLTACGIETVDSRQYKEVDLKLQQYLPLAVLKRNSSL